MEARPLTGWIARLTLLLSMLPSTALYAQSAMREDRQQVEDWNRFANALYDLHRRQLAGHQVRTEQEVDCYAQDPDFYREIRYYDAGSGQLLSTIQWEKDRPDTIHSIQVNVRGDDGRISHDYFAAWLPGHRNAPVQTLVNVHAYDGELAAYRQFDASGVRIYEQCRGQFFGEPVMISLDEHELPLNTGYMPEDVSEALYTSCFEALPTSAERYLKVLADRPETAVPNAAPRDGSHRSRETVEADIQLLTDLLRVTPGNARWHQQRGDAWFQLHEFDKAIADFSSAIDIDPGLDEAWFGRGMALGRNGRVREGIDDLTVYIERHPDSSRAYTKRGVRHIWIGELKAARRDLERAVELDPGNAEANDDLGVIHAQQGRHALAIRHFKAAISHDPSYQKAHHNLAMIYHLGGEDEQALASVDAALRLAPRARTSLLLKAAILESMGHGQEANAISEQAEFLPEGNWSETFPQL